jgi:sec-independent protein translocase protein TatC
LFGSGLVRLLSAAPKNPVGPDGKMALSDHFREFRARILRVVIVWLAAFVVALVFFDQVLDFVSEPYFHAQEILGNEVTEAVIQSAGGSLLLYLKLSGLTASVCTAPYWLYQLWAFVLPGLHRHEKKWTMVFVIIAGPLFLAGLALGYVTLPKGLEILIGLTPDGFQNLVEFNEYLTFFSRTLIVFGIAFEIPVFVVLLNMAGVVKGRSLASHRHWIIIGTFVFAAVATPSADPFTMCAMAIPMVLLFFISEVIARLNDARRARKSPNAGLSPDEASVI